MAEACTPPLRITETGARCRLWLSGCIYGDGTTLQEAADDLIRRVLRVAVGLRAGAPQRASTDLPPLDPGFVALMHEVDQITASGGDIRERLFGVAAG